MPGSLGCYLPLSSSSRVKGIHAYFRWGRNTALISVISVISAIFEALKNYLLLSDVKITLPDGSSRSYPRGVTGLAIAQSISEGLARNALSVEVNGEIWDLGRPIENDASIKIFTWNDKGGKYA